jgi:hypothetical protein
MVRPSKVFRNPCRQTLGFSRQFKVILVKKNAHFWSKSANQLHFVGIVFNPARINGQARKERSGKEFS